jgi:hypothetical protein
MQVKVKSASGARAMIEAHRAPQPREKARSVRRRAPTGRRGALQAIAAAERAERLDPDEALVQKVYALFDPAKLPRALRAPGGPVKCVTPQLRQVVHEVKARYSKLGDKAKAEISRYIRLQKRGNAYIVEYPGGAT